jgi:hypothetical protein
MTPYGFWPSIYAVGIITWTSCRLLTSWVLRQAFISLYSHLAEHGEQRSKAPTVPTQLKGKWLWCVPQQVIWTEGWLWRHHFKWWKTSDYKHYYSRDKSLVRCCLEDTEDGVWYAELFRSAQFPQFEINCYLVRFCVQKRGKTFITPSKRRGWCNCHECRRSRNE